MLLPGQGACAPLQHALLVAAVAQRAPRRAERQLGPAAHTAPCGDPLGRKEEPAGKGAPPAAAQRRVAVKVEQPERGSLVGVQLTPRAPRRRREPRAAHPQRADPLEKRATLAAAPPPEAQRPQA